MKVLEYLDRIFIQVDKKYINDLEIAYLIFLGDVYLDSVAYFKEFYGIEIEFPKICDKKDGRNFQFHVRHALFADTIKKFPNHTILEIGELGETETGLSIPTIKISILLCK